MPPEMLANLPYDGTRADIWSLGIVAFAMATAQLPWDPSEMIKQIMSGNLMFPADFPPDLIPFVSACTRTNPWDRLTATQLMETAWMADEARLYKQRFVSHSIDVSPIPHGLTIRQSRASVRLALPEQNKMAPSEQKKRSILRLNSRAGAVLYRVSHVKCSTGESHD
jgi:serine/threonine protein kinase